MDGPTVDILAARAAARLRQQGVEAEILELHKKALALLADDDCGLATLAAAHERIGRWERDELCHRSYITTWRQWLELPLAVLAAKMLADDELARSMRRNTPFGFVAALTYRASRPSGEP